MPGIPFPDREWSLRSGNYFLLEGATLIVMMIQIGLTVTVSFIELTYTITESKKSKLIDRKRFTRFYSGILRHILIMEKGVIMHGIDMFMHSLRLSGYAKKEPAGSWRGSIFTPSWLWSPAIRFVPIRWQPASLPACASLLHTGPELCSGHPWQRPE